MILKPVNLEFEIIDWGPKMKVGSSASGFGDVKPEQVVAASSWMTYKSGNAREMVVEALESDVDLDEKVGKSLMNSVGRGHASLATSAYVAILFTNASKFVDSLFTGTPFGSSLMPSGRRIPVDEDSIVAPESIANGDSETQRVYYETSVRNIRFYQELIKKGVSKQDAAKITQYGTKGGGFMLLPLETIVAFKQEFESHGIWVPDEGHAFVRKLEDRMKDLGMDNLYRARAFAPRNAYPYPNIFRNPRSTSLVDDLVERYPNVDKPVVELTKFCDTENFQKELEKLYELQQDITKNPDSLKGRWREMLNLRRDIISRYRNVISISSLSKISWRVWGEVKRHRTVPQQPESIYSAVKRAASVFDKYRREIRYGFLSDEITAELSEVFMTPTLDGDLKKRWLNNVLDSLDAYNSLLRKGIKEKDAIFVIPRGVRLHVHKTFDLHNLIEGYIPVRTCITCEPEMLATTRMEAMAVKQLVPELGRFIRPKCSSVGFCPETFKDYEKCKQVDIDIGFEYTEDFHNEMRKEQMRLIEENKSR